MNHQDLLQHCLEEVAQGRQTPAECAALYPHVPGLFDQLLAAEALRHAALPGVRPAAAQRHLAALRAALPAAQAPIPAPIRSPIRAPARRQPAPVRRWALAALVIVALITAGAGTVSAAEASVPGHALYPVKRASEAVQTALTPAAGLAARHASLAQERTDELLSLTGPAAADPGVINTLAAEIGQETDAALAHVDGAPSERQAAVLEQIVWQLERQQTALTVAQSVASPAAQAALAAALTTIQGQHAAALEQLSEVEGAPAVSTATATSTATTTATSTATATATPSATLTAPAPATNTPVPSVQPANTATPEAPFVPPGQANKTETAAAAATAGATITPPGNSGDPSPNCRANSPNSPQYCTPTPAASFGGGEAPTASGSVSATACPVNPAGKPKCD